MSDIVASAEAMSILAKDGDDFDKIFKDIGAHGRAARTLARALGSAVV